MGGDAEGLEALEAVELEAIPMLLLLIDVVAVSWYCFLDVAATEDTAGDAAASDAAAGDAATANAATSATAGEGSASDDVASDDAASDGAASDEALSVLVLLNDDKPLGAIGGKEELVAIELVVAKSAWLVGCVEDMLGTVVELEVAHPLDVLEGLPYAGRLLVVDVLEALPYAGGPLLLSALDALPYAGGALLLHVLEALPYGGAALLAEDWITCDADGLLEPPRGERILDAVLLGTAVDVVAAALEVEVKPPDEAAPLTGELLATPLDDAVWRGVLAAVEEIRTDPGYEDGGVFADASVAGDMGDALKACKADVLVVGLLLNVKGEVVPFVAIQP
nr:hypothetical protein B0A51_09854 [Rachicladosporium sp. CCFEE 5018]